MSEENRPHNIYDLRPGVSELKVAQANLPSIPLREALPAYGAGFLVGGILGFFGQSTPDIAAGSLSAFSVGGGIGSIFSNRLDSEPHLRRTGVAMIGAGLGSAGAYFGIHESLPSYITGGIIGISLSSAPSFFRLLLRR